MNLLMSLLKNCLFFINVTIIVNFNCNWLCYLLFKPLFHFLQFQSSGCCICVVFDLLFCLTTMKRPCFEIAKFFFLGFQCVLCMLLKCQKSFFYILGIIWLGLLWTLTFFLLSWQWFQFGSKAMNFSMPFRLVIS